ncbi:uncharacterized protein BXZ73DRAFT_98008 [Epithele typhae]|uniref:uncharacterized protein n=1 Tax=Epithele typhae TaxID=378194 RepID=UPI002008DB6D|nr:uncharacterized protein BXZ73DRAFT_98008 [Epithele typhae]KAH9941618.1 hypothetical protein BXZ73DRAFT_98008 [Epithele typhae]
MRKAKRAKLKAREAADAKPHEEPGRVVKDNTFYYKMVVFQASARRKFVCCVNTGHVYTDGSVQVENTLFNLPRDKFISDSRVFRSHLSQPAFSWSSDDDPILLKNVTVAQFRPFLQVLFQGNKNHPTRHGLNLTREEWRSVFDLAAKWRFAAVKSRAAEEVKSTLNSCSPDDFVAWVLLARTHNVGSWLVQALTALVVKREEPLDAKDVGPLGIPTVMELTKLREQYLKLSAGARRRRSEAAVEESLTVAGETIEKSVRELFALEIEGLRKATSSGEFGPIDEGFMTRRPRKRDSEAAQLPEAGSKAKSLKCEPDIELD